MDINLREIFLAEDGSHHIYKSKPLYDKRFFSVQKFHQPGLAPVRTSKEAYHINLQGNPAYENRFCKTFGFYFERAATVSNGEWFHIYTDGVPVYEQKYRWCGNFQDGVCVVRFVNGKYAHIDLFGCPLYQNQYNYAGDFRDGIAVIQNFEGLYSHINKRGELIHKKWFQDLDVFHKGFARAKDQSGWFHIDVNGQAIYKNRFQMVEDFYNGQARVENSTGKIEIIDQDGESLLVVREEIETPFQQLSADMVGYWKTQTIKSGVDLGVFDCLPGTAFEVAELAGITVENTGRLLRALEELELVYFEDGRYYLHEKATYLTKKHPQSLSYAAKHWGGSHYLTWSFLTEALKGDKAIYEKVNQLPLFDWLDESNDRVIEYQLAMQAYARHDYEKIARLIDVDNYQTIIDAGGGTGSLLFSVLDLNQNLSGILLERESVIKIVEVPQNLKNRVTLEGFDLFESWPKTADIILLSRVLHDWSDEQARQILANCYMALNSGGKVLVIEFLLNEHESSGGMLDLNMMLIADARERTLADYKKIAEDVGFAFKYKKSMGNYHAMEFVKDAY